VKIENVLEVIMLLLILGLSGIAHLSSRFTQICFCGLFTQVGTCRFPLLQSTAGINDYIYNKEKKGVYIMRAAYD
jgi:hypothetical protein